MNSTNNSAFSTNKYEIDVNENLQSNKADAADNRANLHASRSPTPAASRVGLNSSASNNSTEISVGDGAAGGGDNNDPNGLVDGVRLGGRAHHHNNNFATLCTTSIVTRQLKEHAQENQLHKQISGYKRMRRQHQNVIIQLEMRCRAEIEEHKTKLDKEYKTLLQASGKELEKLQLKHQWELKKKVSETEL
ncbi:Serine/threonine-protein kinase TAO1 [Tyrophagus putrescentiae]|nr:Serine/threonine-protein kinase TAO1 [Tyrophagus putrescentiae]